VVRHLIVDGNDMYVVSGAPDFVFTSEIKSSKLFIRKIMSVDPLASLEKGNIVFTDCSCSSGFYFATEIEWLTSINADLVFMFLLLEYELFSAFRKQVSDVFPIACREAPDAGIGSACITNFRTLSPMDSFSSELGVHVETCMEAPHVIDVGSQLWSAIVSTVPGNYQFNESYKTADAYTFQDELGACLEEICKIVQGASLVFFPTYSLMDKLCKRWSETGQWSRLNAQKSFFVASISLRLNL
ncbi:hypothetical protein MKW98_001789, partial [Papaver atlanticum]